MSIPLNDIVRINPGVLDVGNNANTLYGLMLTKKGTLPANLISSFTNEDQIGKLFGYDSIEYNLATVYFGGFSGSDRTPAELYMAPYYSESSSASLIGATLAAITLEQLRTFSGDLTLSIDGNNISTNQIDLSKVTSFSDAATMIGKALGVTVTYSAGQSAMVITSSKTGSASTIDYATGSLADDMRLSKATGAALSNAVINPTPISLLNTLRTQNNAFSAVFLTWEAEEDEKMLFAQWANAMNNDCCVILSDSSNAAVTPLTGTSFAEQVAAKGYTGIACVYDNLGLCAFLAAYPAAWDLDKSGGRFTAAFRRSTLVTPNVTEKAVSDALQQNGYNYYAIWASATDEFIFNYPGNISGPYLWLDSFFCQIWMRRLFQYYFIRTLMAKGQIPYNTTGKSILNTACIPAITAFVNFGAIQPGIALSEYQTQQLKQSGLTQSQINKITSIGYFLFIDMENVKPADRAKRKSPPISFWYTDGQSVQQILMNSIEVQ